MLTNFYNSCFNLIYRERLLQNFSFCNNNLRFKGKTGLLDGFSKACCETNRVLQQAQRVSFCGGSMKKVGIRHYAQKSYTGKISDSCLYEITQEEYTDWKHRGIKNDEQHCC